MASPSTSTSTSTSTTPTDEQLTNALVQLKAQHPTLGIAKVHAQLLAQHPEWVVSEKRTRRALQGAGLVISNNANGSNAFNVSNTTSGGGGAGAGTGTVPLVYPTSKLIPGLDVGKWTGKVSVAYFGKVKGKGLVATEEIAQGEVVWKEDPFVVAAEWELYDLQTGALACAHCTTPLNRDSASALALTLSCPGNSSSSSSSSSSNPHCSARFCNRLCLSRSAKIHPLLCPAQNPASVPLLKWAREVRWMALHALALTTSRLLLGWQQQGSEGKKMFEEEWAMVRSLAELGYDERWKYSFESSQTLDYTRPAWETAHKLFVQAFKEPTSVPEKKKLAKLLKKPLTQEIDKETFEFDAFLKALGRMSLNLEAHGGIYTLHSHLNHSCSPNISVAHREKRTALSRITAVAAERILPGEELFITYVNPTMGVRQRQHELKAWGFGKCDCARCKEEEEQEAAAAVVGAVGENAKVEEVQVDVDLESELKASFGVM